MDTNPYDNVYLDREGIVKPIPTSPAKSNEIQVAKVKQLKQSRPQPRSSCISEHDDVAFQRINRDQAEQQLSGTPRGTYILRTSVKKTTRGYALSIKSTESDIFDHYKIISDSSGLYIESEYKYHSFQELIHQYQLEKQPVLSAQLLYPMITVTSFDRVFGGILFREDELQISSILGKGEYGQVYTAFINGTKVAAKEIALPLKVPKTAEIKPVRFNEFSEIRLISQLSKPGVSEYNIVLHYGIVYAPGSNLKIIQELVEGGSLLDALKSYGRQHLPSRRLLQYASQIGAGLNYLRNNQIIHRDLAARNVFLTQSLEKAKIGDFGLAITVNELQSLPDDIDTLLRSKVAIKWTAPEALRLGKYSYESDLWSFGIVLWEMWSYGRTPYRKTLVENVLQDIEQKSLRCEVPDYMPQQLGVLLTANENTMWSLPPDRRISIQNLLLRINSIKL